MNPRDRAVDSETLDAIGYALTMLSCPWYRGEGICGSNCREEPACQTSEPAMGWFSEIEDAVNERVQPELLPHYHGPA